MTPTLSVIMPNYNDAAYIEEALDAVLSQSFKANEIFIVDDASTDNSLQIIQPYIEKFKNVRLLRNERNLGSNAAVNRVLPLVKDDYLFFPSANDKILPGFFEKSMGMIERYPQAGISAVDIFFLHPDGRLIREPKEPFSDKPEYFSPSALISRMKNRRFYVPHGCGVIFKRSSFLKAGGFRLDMGSASDWFAIHVMAFRDGLCYVPEALVANRRIPGSISEVSGKNLNLQRNVYRLGHSILKSEYRDVYLSFQKSGAVLAFFGGTYAALFGTLLAHPEYWKSLFPLFVKRAFIKIKRLAASLVRPNHWALRA